MNARTPVFALFVCLALADCGGSNFYPGNMLPGGGGAPPPNNTPVAPPGSNFSAATLNGTYVVSFSGTDLSGGDMAFFAVAGTLTADGAGNFSAGTIDVIDPALGLALNSNATMTHLAATGTYTVTADGRGSGTLSVMINGTAVNFGLDFVLASSAHGLVSRFDGYGTGSGTLDMATAVAQSALAGSYAFGLGGVDSSVTAFLETVGAVTLDASGNITSGLEDFSINGSASSTLDLAVQGTVTAGSPGTATLTTSAASGALHFDVWVIDATHFKLIETDSSAFLEGDALVATGQTSFPAGQVVFTLTGEDNFGGPFSAGGLFTSDGASAITGGIEDVNDAGGVAEIPSFTGSFVASGPRTTVTFNSIFNGASNGNVPISGNYQFVAYAYAGGVMLLEIDDGAGTAPGISGGNAFLQSATSLASSGGYGLNLSGVNSVGEVDMIGEFTTSAGTLSGIYDVNNSGFRITDASLGSGATYSLAANGRGSAQFPNLQTTGNSYIGALDLMLYTVNDSTAIFIETDSGQTATGVLLEQDAASPPATLFHQIRISTAAAPR